jgi:hypothetical protein
MRREPRTGKWITHKACVFCGGKPLTKEHILGDWLKAHVPRLAEWTLHTVSSGSPMMIDGQAVTLEVIERGFSYRSGNPASRSLKIVCGPCNSGWMSRIQDRAKPILVPLLRNAWAREMSTEDRETLATWCALTTTVNEYSHEATRKVSVASRRHLMTMGRMPAGWRVWVGRLDAGGWEGLSHLGWDCTEADAGDPRGVSSSVDLEPHDGQVTAWCLNNVFLLTFFSNPEVPLVDFDAFAREHGLIALWPAVETKFGRPRRGLTWVNADDATRALVKELPWQPRRAWEALP